MKKEKHDFTTIDEYICSCTPDVRKILEEIRKAIKEEAPQAEETISYQMPAFRQNGVLVYFAAFPKHIGFFPTPSGITAFEKEITKYKHAKGSVQFPIGEPMPLDLIRRIVRFRVRENEAKK